MPTLKPRTTVTLDPSTHEIVERLAFHQKRSRGAVIADLLDSVAPALSRTVALLEAASAAPQQVKDGLRAVVEGTHDDLVRAGGEATRQLDILLQDLQKGSISREANPHVVTRGSGIPTHAEEALPKKPRKPRKPRGLANE